jgi:phage terminase small subunit
MATRGRKPAPTNLKLLHGVKPSRINTAEPVPSEQPIVPPYELEPDAQAVWDRLAPDRIAKGCLTHWDVDAFAALCQALVILRTAHTEPFSVWRTAVGIADRLGAQFGWTPSERARLHMRGSGRPGEDDDLLTDPARLLS